jgi:hypothetical protein
MKTNFKKMNIFINKRDKGILDFNNISLTIDKFFNDIMNPLSKDQFITFQFMFKLYDNTFRTLGYLNKIN